MDGFEEVYKNELIRIMTEMKRHNNIEDDDIVFFVEDFINFQVDKLGVIRFNDIVYDYAEKWDMPTYEVMKYSSDIEYIGRSLRQEGGEKSIQRVVRSAIGEFYKTNEEEDYNVKT